MIVVRFEIVNSRFNTGLFCGRYKCESYWVRKCIDQLSKLHEPPEGEDADACSNGLSVRSFKDVKGLDCAKFAFTTKVFEDRKFARALVLLARRKCIKMRVIVNPEVVWVGYSGIQCVFVDSETNKERETREFLQNVKEQKSEEQKEEDIWKTFL